jgi:S-DNA-T family DNA segregation ATPase FtsK/SpoIIIE
MTLRRRLRELGGLALFAAVGVAVFALATWSVNDPSLSYATSAPVRNVLGVTGAITADLAMQLFGIAAIAIILPPAFWGWRFFTHRVFDRLRWRLLAWSVGLILSAAFASTLTRPSQWPLPTGIGGVTGDAILGVVAAVGGGPIHGVGQIVAAWIFGALAFVAIGVACGFGCHRRDIDDSDDVRGISVSLGWLVHAFLSLRARTMLAARPLFEMLGRPAPAQARRASPPALAAH